MVAHLVDCAHHILRESLHQQPGFHSSLWPFAASHPLCCLSSASLSNKGTKAHPKTPIFGSLKGEKLLIYQLISEIKQHVFIYL